MAEDGATLYAVLDAARDPAILPMLRQCAPDAQSLFHAAVDRRLAGVGPYLAPVAPGTPLARRWRQEGRGRAWGILCAGPPDLAAVRHHLRTLLRVVLPGQDAALFRFYDPRVLRLWLPVCDPQQLRRTFGPLRRFHAETEDGAATLTYTLRGGQLHTK